jgi:flagellar biosynthesis protein FlhF
MRIRTFRARTVAAAMSAARAELGPDALILGTRRVADGVELTAATEPDEEIAPLAPLAPAPVPVPPSRDAAVEKALAAHGLPEA